MICAESDSEPFHRVVAAYRRSAATLRTSASWLPSGGRKNFALNVAIAAVHGVSTPVAVNH